MKIKFIVFTLFIFTISCGINQIPVEEQIETCKRFGLNDITINVNKSYIMFNRDAQVYEVRCGKE